MARHRHIVLFLCFASMIGSCSGPSSKFAGVVDDLDIKRPPTPVPGKTVASPGLQRDVVDIILAVDGAGHKECQNYGVKNSDVVNPPGVDRNWKERWLIDRCGTPIAWDVEFTHDPKGGTNIVVTIPNQ